MVYTSVSSQYGLSVGGTNKLGGKFSSGYECCRFI